MGWTDFDGLEEVEKHWMEGVEYLKGFHFTDSEHEINHLLRDGKSILCEGAQGTMLDVDFGSYPFVTSSNTIGAGACTGLGIGANKVGNVFGIMKAYCTRVGSGPFPTELFDETGKRMRDIGHEYGAVTGRERRCGWIDLVQLRYSIMVDGVTELIMMKSDVLDTFDTIKACVAYRLPRRHGDRRTALRAGGCHPDLQRDEGLEDGHDAIHQRGPVPAGVQGLHPVPGGLPRDPHRHHQHRSRPRADHRERISLTARGRTTSPLVVTIHGQSWPLTKANTMANKPSIPKGTRDFGPEEMAKRNYIFDTIKAAFQLYGFRQIETPAMETLHTLMGKYGEEGDKLLFKVLNSGDYLKKVSDEELADRNVYKLQTKLCEKGLRYDLTVPFARYVVMHREELQMPFKRYQIQPVWRADRPQKGRYREFYQCDADVVGSDSLLNEVELVQIMDTVFTRFGVRVAIKVNNRKILTGIAEVIGEAEKIVDITVAIDKIDKIGVDGVNAELRSDGISEEAIARLQPIINLQGTNDEKLATIAEVLRESETGLKGVEEVRFILDTLKGVGLHNTVELDLTLARGLNYYTGAIFEVKALDVEIGSITGGGRYDNLTGIFGMPGLSGVGFSFGADRIYDVLNALDLYPKGEPSGHGGPLHQLRRRRDGLLHAAGGQAAPGGHCHRALPRQGEDEEADELCQRQARPVCSSGRRERDGRRQGDAEGHGDGRAAPADRGGSGSQAPPIGGARQSSPYSYYIYTTYIYRYEQPWRRPCLPSVVARSVLKPR